MEQDFAAQTDIRFQAQKKVYAGSLERTRKAMNRLLNEFLQDPEADVQRYRATIYTLKSIGELHRIEKELDVERRLEELEEKLS